MPKTRLAGFVAVVGSLAFTLGLSAAAFASPSSSIKAPLLVQAQTNKQAKRSQNKIDKLASQKDAALQSYLTTLQQTERLNAYNKQITKLIKSQKQSVVKIKQQMKRLGTEEKEVTPLMLHMIDGLKKFVKADMPFHRQKRLADVDKLADMMDDSDVSIAEKFRHIMGAYQDQVDYGNTVKAYRDKLTAEGSTRTVQFVRIGRVALMYQTLDGSETGYWNRNTGSWKVDNGLRDQFNTALGVAQKSGAPQLIVAPVSAPQTAEAE